MVPSSHARIAGSTITFAQRFAHAYREMEQMDASQRTAAERT